MWSVQLSHVVLCSTQIREGLISNKSRACLNSQPRWTLDGELQSLSSASDDWEAGVKYCAKSTKIKPQSSIIIKQRFSLVLAPVSPVVVVVLPQLLLSRALRWNPTQARIVFLPPTEQPVQAISSHIRLLPRSNNAEAFLRQRTALYPRRIAGFSQRCPSA